MKQFSKIKHLADKAFIRPDRTEVLSEDLLAAEKRIELIKKTCDSTAKKVAAGLQCSNKDGQQGKEEKRIRKTPHFILGNDMAENGNLLDPSEGSDFSSVLGSVLREAGEIEIKVANELVVHEMGVESTILAKLQTLMENDLQNINKTKKSLSKLSSDMDSARAKLAQANRHSMSAATSGKIDNIKDDLDDTQQKVEQCRDNLAAEMYQLISRESEISQYIVNYLQLQRDYHRTVAHVYEQFLPNVETILANSFHKPVYGTGLEEHLSCISRPIAYPLELCVCGLMLNGLKEEGLFRIAGSASKVKKLKAAFDAGLIDLETLRQKFSDPHVIANALKCYFRELSSPLLTYDLYDEWMEAIQNPNSPAKLQSLWTIINKKLPKPNFENLRYLIRFLWELSKHQSVNKMSPANIAIVIGPNLLWTRPSEDAGNEGPIGLNMTMTHLYTSLVDQLVTYAEYFFPDEIEFFQTYPRPAYSDDYGGLPNGSSDDGGVSNPQSENEGLVSTKRSQSSSSLEDHNSPPQGSPKPVLRRKNKPAPVPPPALIKCPPSSGNQGKPVQHQDSSSPKQSFSSDSSSTSEVTPKRVTTTKREGMWIPPSPSQTNNRKHLGGGNNNSSDSPTATVPMKVTPPKPPQPQFSHHKDPDSKGSFGDGSSSNKSVGQINSSTLRHKSSFSSGGGAADLVGLGSSSGASGSNSGSLQYSSSLPRHFHTENSYKNQRAPRPPSIFAAIPTVPNTHPGNADHSNKPDTSLKEHVVQSHQSTTATPPVNLPESTVNVHTSALGLETGHIGAKNSAISQQGVGIGFEVVESQVKALSDYTGSNAGTDPSNKTELSSTGQSAALDSKPVPAPRSSLLLQNVSIIGKEKEGITVPSVKERPTLMAKPRDLAKRSQPISTGANYINFVGAGDSSSSPPDVPISISAETVGFRLSVESEESKDSGNLDDSQLRNGGVKDKNLPPASPRAPNRPPRPQPPPPPKLKTESTDL